MPPNVFASYTGCARASSQWRGPCMSTHSLPTCLACTPWSTLPWTLRCWLAWPCTQAAREFLLLSCLLCLCSRSCCSVCARTPCAHALSPAVCPQMVVCCRNWTGWDGEWLQLLLPDDSCSLCSFADIKRFPRALAPKPFRHVYCPAGWLPSGNFNIIDLQWWFSEW